jgi:anti-sigma factor RsiW
VSAPGGITCREVVDLATDYLEGALDHAARARLEVHLETCGPCSEYIEQMRTTIRLAAAAEREQRPDAAALLEAFRALKR